MTLKIRCTECWRTVPAAPTTKGAQKVCCAECRRKRDRKLARKRRRANLQEYRRKDVLRKRLQRERQKQGRVLTAAQGSASWQASGESHAPGSGDNRPQLLKKIAKIVDDCLAVSRVRLCWELAQMAMEQTAQLPMAPARAGP